MSATAKKVWNESFEDQVAQNAQHSVPVEALVRTVSYYLRNHKKNPEDLHFLELGFGNAINMCWFANRGFRMSGIDVSNVAIDLAKTMIAERGVEQNVDQLVEGTIADMPFEDNTFDGVVETYVLQHLANPDRANAFKEIHRVLKPGGVFIAYLSGRDCSVYQKRKAEELSEDPGTINLESGNNSRIYLDNLGTTHFYSREELESLLAPFSMVDLAVQAYDVPKEEAEQRGYDKYTQSMWIVYARK